jgi:hypothetical protein
MLFPTWRDAGTFAALLATVLLVPSAARAGTQAAEIGASTAPVRVTSCRVTSELLSTDVDHPSEQVADRLSFRLTNISSSVATEVGLRVQYGALTQTLVERGMFSTGVRVERTSEIVAFAPWIGVTPKACTVISVKFANGTAWIAPNNRVAVL